jgi:hypothetical protein
MSVTVTISKFNLFQVAWLLTCGFVALLIWINGFSPVGLEFAIKTTTNLCMPNTIILAGLTLYNTYLKIRGRKADHSPLICLTFLVLNLFYIAFIAGLAMPVS